MILCQIGHPKLHNGVHLEPWTVRRINMRKSRGKTQGPTAPSPDEARDACRHDTSLLGSRAMQIGRQWSLGELRGTEQEAVLFAAFTSQMPDLDPAVVKFTAPPILFETGLRVAAGGAPPALIDFLNLVLNYSPLTPGEARILRPTCEPRRG